MVRTQLEGLGTWLGSCSSGSSETPLHDSARLADVLTWGCSPSSLKGLCSPGIQPGSRVSRGRQSS